MAYSYNLPDGKYIGRPTLASCFEKDGVLRLDIKFAVKDPKTGEWYKNERGYDFEVTNFNRLTTPDGAFNQRSIDQLKKWAKDWSFAELRDFWWFQQPGADGTPFGNLKAIGEVELVFKTDGEWQHLYINPLGGAQGGGSRTAYTPDGAITDPNALMAKWGAKAKAVASTMAKPLASQQAAKKAVPAAEAASPAAAPARPAARPSAAPAAPAAKPDWSEFPQNADGCFAYFCTKVGGYKGEKHDEIWFGLQDKAAPGKDPDEYTPADVQALFKAVSEM